MYVPKLKKTLIPESSIVMKREHKADALFSKRCLSFLSVRLTAKLNVTNQISNFPTFAMRG